MNDSELNLRLKQELESLAPNRLEDLLAVCGEQAPVQPNRKSALKARSMLPRLIAAAAALVLLSSGLFYGLKDARRTVVTVDAGASVYMTVNGFDRVKRVSVYGLDADTGALRGMSLGEASEAVARDLLDAEKLSEAANGVLVTVRDADGRRADALGRSVAEGLARASETAHLEPAILLQHVKEKISGVAALAQSVAERSAGIDLAAAEALSVQELLYAVHSQALPLENATFIGAPLNWSCGSAQDAEQIAADYAGIASDTGFTTLLSVYEDSLAYAVRFESDGQWLQYWVSAAAGELLNPAPTAPAAAVPNPSASAQGTPSGQGNIFDSYTNIQELINSIDDLL